MIFLVLTLLLQLARAETPWDLSMSTGAQWFPEGFALNAVGGYNLPIWGEKKSDDIWYGFLRPHVKAQTSILVQRGEAILDFHPISFIELQVGQAASYRSVDTKPFDCTVVGCRGLLSGTFVKSAIFAGTHSVWLMGGAKFYRFQSGSVTPLNPDFVDENSNLQGLGPNETLRSLDVGFGFRFHSSWIAGAAYSHNRMLLSGMESKLAALYAQWKSGQWSVSFGGGRYESDVFSPGATAFVEVSWTPFPSLEL